ncbi:ABC-type nitrate/sulfonate/bicarbonate transport system, ATpase component [Clostridium aceticum]|uniref:ABC-type quaternary amine transporter n=1 Tax=Clostridium aceticum TaxID=84022 RepID=A0A0D8IBG9_9CLOT|nr:ABC transporter ATP-binding protein [Clostridium aceticum]AKL96906.1 ABC-type nitrate/sulfonate/bicarbonate transport system, ATpase component [Clostridium aceticum]KJF27638.1 nitrate ABC transporter ATP-binding protein [Clostridium aceticum]
MEQPILRINGIYKKFVTEKGNTINALDKIDINIQENEFICILGPSGCGKSTLLRIIAGLEKPSMGEVYYKNQEIKKCHKEIGMVFQQYTLLPWRTIIENIALGLEINGMDKKQRIDKARKYLSLVGLEKFETSFPYELSGGMQQRVAIARVLANDSNVLLMDEPFGALDAHTRVLLQRELLEIWKKNKKTVIFVTHSVDESIYLADKIVIMSKSPGKIKKIIDVNIERPRERSNIAFGKLSTELFDML